MEENMFKKLLGIDEITRENKELRKRLIVLESRVRGLEYYVEFLEGDIKRKVRKVKEWGK